MSRNAATPPARPLEALAQRDARLGRAKTAGRLAVEKVLRSAPHPISIALIAARAGLDVKTTRRHVHNATANSSAHNANVGKVPALYAWGAAPLPDCTPSRSAQSPVRSGRASPSATGYDGAELRPYEGRPGAMVAFSLPSLVDGTSVARRPPLLITCKPQERR